MNFLQPVRTIQQILNHPINQNQKLRAFGRIVRWQAASRIWPGKLIVPFAGDARLLVGRKMCGATGNIYCGLHDYEDMALVLHALREQDTFIDIGANVGSYTVLAAAVAKAHTIAFEPVPHTYADLLDNIRLNGVEGRVLAYNQGVGAERGMLQFTTDRDSGNHVIVNGAEPDDVGTTVNVPILPLDDLPNSVEPTLIKIDVEGYETPVLDGAERMLNSPTLLGVLMELNGSGALYGFDDVALHQRMLNHGFRPCAYRPAERTLHQLESHNSSLNTLYVRDIARLSEKVRTSPRVRVLDTTV